MVEQVQLTDLENAAYLPKGRCIKGMLAGNDNWRSPEAHFKGELNKPSDMFSFGLVVSGCRHKYIALTNPASVSMLFLVVLYAGQTRISQNTRPKELYQL